VHARGPGAPLCAAIRRFVGRPRLRGLLALLRVAGEAVTASEEAGDLNLGPGPTALGAVAELVEGSVMAPWVMPASERLRA
ncbi:hypothetical protein, partial [Jatrophihabitans sp.]|uniref:hypothetical protein n=1 Tax=Jatrophihabitans sp. TaxID=1932789 RepID=UPI0030C6FAF0|nr:hypothetical protein [Jatrophihabitans sp.]